MGRAPKRHTILLATYFRNRAEEPPGFMPNISVCERDLTWEASTSFRICNFSSVTGTLQGSPQCQSFLLNDYGWSTTKSPAFGDTSLSVGAYRVKIEILKWEV